MFDYIRKIVRLLFYKELSRIEKYKNFYQDETCYIFGSGPSIKYINIGDFSDKVGIASNWLVFHKDYHKLRVKFITEIDPFALSPMFNTLIKDKKRIQKWKKVNKFNKYFLKNIIKNRSMLLTNISNFGLKFSTEYDKNQIIFVNDKFPFYLYSSHEKLRKLDTDSQIINGTLRFQINLAIYFGFKSAILVGHDYISNHEFAGHWFEKGITRQDCDVSDWNRSFLEDVSKVIDLKFVTLNKNIQSKYELVIYPLDKQIYKENSRILESSSIEYLRYIKEYVMV